MPTDTLRIVSEKIKLGIPCELSAKQTIHMKCQALRGMNLNLCILRMLEDADVVSRLFIYDIPLH